MKIIHFSDTHLGFSDLDIINSDGINQREADFYRAFSDIIDKIIETKPNYVIHTGDLFHRASPSNRAITFALKELKRVEKLAIPLIIIAGNHSTPRTHSSSPILEALNTLDNVIAVFNQHYEKAEFEDIVFHALPHINDEREIEDELKKIEQGINKGKKNILMMHCSVGAHYLMHEFGEWVYPKEKEYIFEQMDYVALGHWHGFGSVSKHKNVYYAGSTERTSSSDKRDNKGYVLVDLSDKLEIDFKKIALRKSLEFTIDSESFEADVESLDMSDIKDALVEVKLINLTASSSIDITNSQIEEIFKEALSVKIRREFRETKQEEIAEDIESLSLESYFISHIKEGLEDEEEKERLAKKAKELFSLYEEIDDDTI